MSALTLQVANLSMGMPRADAMHTLAVVVMVLCLSFFAPVMPGGQRDPSTLHSVLFSVLKTWSQVAVCPPVLWPRQLWGGGQSSQGLQLRHCLCAFLGLMLQVLGNAKGAVAAVVSVLVFHNPVTSMGAFGFFITICGVVLYGESMKRFKGSS